MTTIPVPPSNGEATLSDNPAAKQHDHNLPMAWLSGNLWSKGVSPALRKGWSKLTPQQAWKRWRTYLRRRKAPLPLARLVASQVSADLWCLDDNQPARDLVNWHGQLTAICSSEGRLPQEDFETLLADPLSHALAGHDMQAIQQALSIAWQIDHLASVLEADDWWHLVAQLLWLAQSSIDESQGDEVEGERVLAATWLTGELPLVLSYMLPEIAPLRGLRDHARTSLGEGLLSLTDGEGLVAADFLPEVPALAASWTRCRAIGATLKKNCWSASAETQYQWLTRQLLRLTLPGGGMLLSSGRLLNWPAGMLGTALELAGDAADRAAANARHQSGIVPATPRARTTPLVSPSVNSGWAGVAVLASDWSPSANVVGVAYRGPHLQLDIVAAGVTLFSGEWLSHSSAGGTPLPITGHWEEQCWYSDADLDYLDIVVDLAGGAKLERQIALLKQDQCLLLHEALLTDHAEAIPLTHEAHLPLAQHIDFVPEHETRDGLLVDGRGRAVAAVLPLALGEWRAETHGGELTTVGHHLELSQSQLGRRMSVPLWFDLNPRRVKRERTWRRLTVAEQLDRQPRDVAVGYRVQCQRDQWLLYRSLADPGNRTVLGQNLSSEGYLGRFGPGGQVHELIEIEASDE